MADLHLEAGAESARACLSSVQGCTGHATRPSSLPQALCCIAQLLKAALQAGKALLLLQLQLGSGGRQKSRHWGQHPQGMRRQVPAAGGKRFASAITPPSCMCDANVMEGLPAALPH